MEPAAIPETIRNHHRSGRGQDEDLKQLQTINARIGAWRTLETDCP